jgi:hypothetical protein
VTEDRSGALMLKGSDSFNDIFFRYLLWIHKTLPNPFLSAGARNDEIVLQVVEMRRVVEITSWYSFSSFSVSSSNRDFVWLNHETKTAVNIAARAEIVPDHYRPILGMIKSKSFHPIMQKFPYPIYSATFFDSCRPAIPKTSSVAAPHLQSIRQTSLRTPALAEPIEFSLGFLADFRPAKGLWATTQMDASPDSASVKKSVSGNLISACRISA